MNPEAAIAEYVTRDFGTFQEFVALQAELRPDAIAVRCGTAAITYAQLNARANLVATGLQRDGVKPKGVVAICANSSIDYTAIFIGTLRAGAAISPLSPSATPQQLSAMIADCGATHLFLDAAVSSALAQVAGTFDAVRIALEDGAVGRPLAKWLPDDASALVPVAIEPDWPFNIIYSSGTTGTPKGIVQSYRMRWPHNHLVNPPGFGPSAVALISTPLYSNTTLVHFIPTLSGGGTAILMPKFDPLQYLEIAERYRVTHTMLVPSQYRRILDVADFDRFDLSSFQVKFATSAPFPAELKAAVLARWPGGLIEYYGMTEGGGSCMLIAHEHLDKLSTVGRPMPGHDIRVIGEDGTVLGAGEVGEVVGHSGAMMTGYYNRPEQTAEAEWISPEGKRFIRTGDLAVVDEDGFFTLIGRKKDMILSGGFNIYPVDLEDVLLQHPAVREAAVVGAKSERWGETPVAFVTLEPNQSVEASEVKAFANAALGKFQRLADVRIIDVLPRSAIGKILKRELLDRLSVEDVKY